MLYLIACDASSLHARCDAIVSELLDVQYEDLQLVGDANVEENPLSQESIASFLGWLQDEVLAEDLEDWRQDATRLYSLSDDDDEGSLPGMDINVDSPGASASMSGADEADDDDDELLADDELVTF